MRLDKRSLSGAGFEPGQKVHMELTPTDMTAGELFGKLPHKGNTAKILDEIDRAYGEK